MKDFFEFRELSEAFDRAEFQRATRGMTSAQRSEYRLKMMSGDKGKKTIRGKGKEKWVSKPKADRGVLKDYLSEEEVSTILWEAADESEDLGNPQESDYLWGEHAESLGRVVDERRGAKKIKSVHAETPFDIIVWDAKPTDKRFYLGWKEAGYHMTFAAVKGYKSPYDDPIEDRDLVFVAAGGKLNFSKVAETVESMIFDGKIK